MNEINDTRLPQLYSLTAIGIATALGSALAGGFMIFKNYQALGQPRPGGVTLLGSLAIVLAFILIPAQLDMSASTAILLPIAQIILVLFLAHKLQGPMFTTFEEMGGSYHPLWHTLVIGIGASIVMLMLGMLLVALFGQNVLPQPVTPPAS